jgi:hypothetical protein
VEMVGESRRPSAKILEGLAAVAAGMGCFDCAGSSFGRSRYAQHDKKIYSTLTVTDSEAMPLQITCKSLRPVSILLGISKWVEAE